MSQISVLPAFTSRSAPSITSALRAALNAIIPMARSTRTNHEARYAASEPMTVHMERDVGILDTLHSAHAVYYAADASRFDLWRGGL